jgi:hypothetical protein
MNEPKPLTGDELNQLWAASKDKPNRDLTKRLLWTVVERTKAVGHWRTYAPLPVGTAIHISPLGIDVAIRLPDGTPCEPISQSRLYQATHGPATQPRLLRDDTVKRLYLAAAQDAQGWSLITQVWETSDSERAYRTYNEGALGIRYEETRHPDGRYETRVIYPAKEAADAGP